MRRVDIRKIDIRLFGDGGVGKNSCILRQAKDRVANLGSCFSYSERIDIEIDEVSVTVDIHDHRGDCDTRVGDLRSFHHTYPSDGVIIVYDMTELNRQPNYYLAKELSADLETTHKPISEIFADVDRRSRIVGEKKLQHHPNFSNRGIRYGDLNDILNLASRALRYEPVRASDLRP